MFRLFLAISISTFLIGCNGDSVQNRASTPALPDRTLEISVAQQAMGLGAISVDPSVYSGALDPALGYRPGLYRLRPVGGADTYEALCTVDINGMQNSAQRRMAAVSTSVSQQFSDVLDSGVVRIVTPYGDSSSPYRMLTVNGFTRTTFQSNSPGMSAYEHLLSSVGDECRRLLINARHGVLAVVAYAESSAITIERGGGTRINPIAGGGFGIEVVPSNQPRDLRVINTPRVFAMTGGYFADINASDFAPDGRYIGAQPAAFGSETGG